MVRDAQQELNCLVVCVQTIEGPMLCSSLCGIQQPELQTLAAWYVLKIPTQLASAGVAGGVSGSVELHWIPDLADACQGSARTTCQSAKHDVSAGATFEADKSRPN